MVETTARQVIISMLILGAVIAGCFTLISSMLPTDNTFNFAQTNTTLNQFSKIKNNSDTIQSQFPIAKPDPGLFGLLNAFYGITWGAFISMWDSYYLFSSIITDTANGALGVAIPYWFSGMLIAIIAISLVFALLAAWYKWHI